MDRLDGIAAFSLVVETGSFTAAAQRLKLSKSAVSAHVQRLEERLGIQLLHRTTRRVATTEAGRTYHQYCVRILAEAEAAEQAAGALHREPRGTLRISAPDTFGWMHVAPVSAPTSNSSKSVGRNVDIRRQAERWVEPSTLRGSVLLMETTIS
jgi:DNA-binding transcriptional LysR family regulator